ncbi:transposase [Streptomyces sp. NPDC001153]
MFEDVRERGCTGGESVVKNRLTDDQAQRLKEILARCLALDRTPGHVRVFAELMNNRKGRDLDQWITSVQADDLPALRTFVTGLGQDLDGVVAGLSLRYSSGAVEGHNNKSSSPRKAVHDRGFGDPPWLWH